MATFSEHSLKLLMKVDLKNNFILPQTSHQDNEEI